MDPIEAYRKIAPDATRIIEEKLKAAQGAAGGDPSQPVKPKFEFKPEQVQMMLELAAFAGDKLISEWLNYSRASPEDLKKWAELTQTVYGEWLKSLEAGVAIHAIFTLSLVFGKEKLPEKVKKPAPAGQPVPRTAPAPA